jgi:hypothetical protein
VHSARAWALALQFAWHFASTLQSTEALRLPPLQEIVGAETSHVPLHLAATLPCAWQVPVQPPLQVPLQRTLAPPLIVHVPEHVPLHVPSVWMPPPFAAPPAAQVPSHLPLQSTTAFACAVHAPVHCA